MAPVRIHRTSPDLRAVLLQTCRAAGRRASRSRGSAFSSSKSTCVLLSGTRGGNTAAVSGSVLGQSSKPCWTDASAAAINIINRNFIHKLTLPEQQSEVKKCLKVRQSSSRTIDLFILFGFGSEHPDVLSVIVYTKFVQYQIRGEWILTGLVSSPVYQRSVNASQVFGSSFSC